MTGTGQKLLIFAHHHVMMDAIAAKLGGLSVPHIKIDGRSDKRGRQASVELFQKRQEVRAALVSITTCGHGLNLVAAETVVFAELFWVPGRLLQAEDRAHRLGSRGQVDVHYCIAEGTLDEIIFNLLDRKYRGTKMVIDAGNEAAAHEELKFFHSVSGTKELPRSQLGNCDYVAESSAETEDEQSGVYQSKTCASGPRESKRHNDGRCTSSGSPVRTSSFFSPSRKVADTFSQDGDNDSPVCKDCGVSDDDEELLEEGDVSSSHGIAKSPFFAGAKRQAATPLREEDRHGLDSRCMSSPERLCSESLLSAPRVHSRCSEIQYHHGADSRVRESPLFTGPQKRNRSLKSTRCGIRASPLFAGPKRNYSPKRTFKSPHMIKGCCGLASSASPSWQPFHQPTPLSTKARLGQPPLETAERSLNVFTRTPLLASRLVTSKKRHTSPDQFK